MIEKYVNVVNLIRSVGSIVCSIVFISPWKFFCHLRFPNKHSHQQDTESDNHSENVILTKEDQKIILTVSELLGIEAEQLKQVSVV